MHSSRLRTRSSKVACALERARASITTTPATRRPRPASPHASHRDGRSAPRVGPLTPGRGLVQRQRRQGVTAGGATSRIETIRGLIARVGGTMESFHFAFGGTDVIRGPRTQANQDARG